MKSRPGSLVLNAMLAGLTALAIAGCDKPPVVAVTPQPVTTVGTDIDDGVVTTRVKSTLLADPEVKSIDFKIETRKGQVQLSGFVDDQAQVERAITLIREVPGVKGIENHVELKGTATTVGEKVDDGILTTRVKTAFLADENVKGTDIAVVTRNGKVQLSGFVDNQGQIDRAVEVARSVDGVGSVADEMSIKK